MQLKKLGPYRLSRKLGQGGMGAVYEGLEESSGQVAAVKVLSPHLAGEEGFRVRFEAEIESLKKLRHPNIVRLYGYGEDEGALFYSMELVEGTSLEEELRAGRRFNWREVTQLAIKLCRALKHAHDHGVIHRDIKPANLLLSGTGEIKLSDFGIARLFGNTRLTSDGGLLGTAEYMAPEQADGRPVTERCDQYSLGGVMYALLAGRAPFRASSMLEMLQLQRYAEPDPVRRYAPDTPAELDRIIRQLLEKDPQKRFVNAAILARSLEAMERGLSLSSQRDDFLVPSEDLPITGRSIDSLAPTLVPSEQKPSAKASKLPRENLDAELLSATDAGSVHEPRSAPVVVGEPGVRFTKVDESDGEHASGFQELVAALTSWQTIGALLGLAAVVLTIVWALRPPAADTLYERIEQAAASSNAGALSGAKTQMQQFLELYPDDDRTPQVRDYLAEIKAQSEQRRLDRQAQQLSRPGARSPIERAYLDAALLKVSNPELAIVKFQALVDLYGPREKDAPEDHWIHQARGELKLLEKQVADNQREDRLAIEDRLASAERLRRSEPEAARQIWQAIVELYGDKAWAAPLVEQARSALAAGQTARE